MEARRASSCRRRSPSASWWGWATCTARASSSTEQVFVKFIGNTEDDHDDDNDDDADDHDGDGDNRNDDEHKEDGIEHDQ